MSEFFHMGGYGRYVWSAYGIAMLVLAYNLLAPIIHGRHLKQRLRERLEKLEKGVTEL